MNLLCSPPHQHVVRLLHTRVLRYSGLVYLKFQIVPAAWSLTLLSCHHLILPLCLRTEVLPCRNMKQPSASFEDIKRTLNIPRLDERRNSLTPRSCTMPVRIGKVHLVQIFLIFPEVEPVTGATATYLILMCSKIKGRVVIETTKGRLYSEQGTDFQVSSY